MAEQLSPVLHVVVIGFHHKKGCQVEYSYPPLVDGESVDSNKVPDEWRHLASLALPDGAHNYTKDTIFFHLQSRTQKKSTVFGVSCYRQIDAIKLLKRTSDVTRNTVQKSVCVISLLPLYGLIEAKLELITHAYFRELDFSQVTLLEDTYKSLNASLNEHLLHDSQIHIGLPARLFVQKFKHKILILFKLMMLERKVLFFSSPAGPNCQALLTLLTFFPGMIEHGLIESASYHPSRKLSSTLHTTSVGNDCEDYLEIHYSDNPFSSNVNGSSGSTEGAQQSRGRTWSLPEEPVTKPSVTRQRTASDVNQPRLKTSPNATDPFGRSDITVLHPVQLKSQLQSDQGILEESPESSSHIGPLESLKDITHVKSVQRDNSVEKGELEAAVGGSTDMEELLDGDDCFTWQEEGGRLSLQIADAINDQPSSNTQSAESSPEHALNLTTGEESKHNEDKIVGDFVDVNLVSGEESGHAPVHRADSIGSQSSNRSSSSAVSNLSIKAHKLKHKISSALHTGNENKIELQDMRPVSPSSIHADENGFPLSIFTKGMLCHPYLPLHYYDVLTDINVRGFVLGATNILFKQKRNLLDVIIDAGTGQIDILDPDLSRQLSLSTADLRFSENLVRNVLDEKGSIYLDETEWEGGDEWIRDQFRIYLTSMLSTVLNGDEKQQEEFNGSFISSWRTTSNFKLWRSSDHSGISTVESGHVCTGSLSMSDVKLKLSHSLQSSERGKKVNAAVDQAGRAMAHTGRAVVQTSRVVGGAFTSAKSAMSKTMSSWFGGFTKDTKETNSENNENTDEAGNHKDPENTSNVGPDNSRIDTAEEATISVSAETDCLPEQPDSAVSAHSES